ncbi:MAG: acyl carrier protein [Bacteroidetes bacterium]|nr:acyl carrier protein [Bacteroidota bacterium]MDA0851610.1 acyl carrier protein [Pseudomonadota bacterium]
MEDRVVDLLKKVFPKEQDSITSETSSQTLSSWDSLKQMKIVLLLEEEFAVEVPDDLVAELTSVELILEFLNENA